MLILRLSSLGSTYSHAKPAGTVAVALGPALAVYELASSDTLAQALALGAPALAELELEAGAVAVIEAVPLLEGTL